MYSNLNYSFSIFREQEEREDRLRQKHTRLAGAGVNSGKWK